MDDDWIIPPMPAYLGTLPWLDTPAGREAQRNNTRRTQLLWLLDEAGRAARFLDGIGSDGARYRARELRAAMAAAKEEL